MNTPTANGPRPAHRLALGVAVLATALGAALAGCSGGSTTTAPGGAPAPAPAPEDPTDRAWFRNVTAGSGLEHTFRNGREAGNFAILETLGGGVGLLDYDGDGLLDVFVVGGGYYDGPDKKQIKAHPCKLYRNLGNFKFEDATAKVGLDKVDWWYTHGVAMADYDRDGQPDFVVTGYGRIELFHNEPDDKGGRKFVAVGAKLGMKDDQWATSAGWADLDGDGFPELYVCCYCDWSFANHPTCPALTTVGTRDTCGPGWFKPRQHVLFHNNNGRGFARRSIVDPMPSGFGLGVVIADLNGDGKPDVYVGNDTTDNFLFVNRGGKFDEIGQRAGVATNELGRADGSMGVDVADFDGTGRASIFVTNFQTQYHALYRNLGKESFLHQSQAVGVAALGQNFVGFGTGFIDGDNDGWEDLVIANGHVYNSLPEDVERQRPILMRNVEQQGRRYFKEGGTRGEPFFQTKALGRGLAVGDLNNDGWPDLIFVHSNTPVAVLRNVAVETGAANWIGVKLVGKDRRDVVGSTAVAEVGGRKLTRFAKGGGSYLSASDPRLVFGLGSADKVTRVTVKWSWGAEQTWENLTPGSYWELREGEPVAVKVPGR